MIGRRSSHFGDGLLHGGGDQGVCRVCTRTRCTRHFRGGRLKTEDAFRVAETHSFVDFSDSRLMCQGKQFNSMRAHASPRSGLR
jgi:hypothetical protein